PVSVAPSRKALTRARTLGRAPVRRGVHGGSFRGTACPARIGVDLDQSPPAPGPGPVDQPALGVRLCLCGTRQYRADRVTRSGSGLGGPARLRRRGVLLTFGGHPCAG